MQAALTLPPPKIDAAGLSVCRGLGNLAAGRIVAISSLRKVKPGEVLFVEGEDARNIYEILGGMLRLYKMLPDGRRQIVGFPTAGHMLGLAPEGAHIYSAEAVSEVTLCCYPRASFDRLIDNVPGLARRLWAVTSDELRFAQDQMVMLGCKSAVEKVASFLLHLAREKDAGATEVALPITRNDMADYLGLTIETVSRALSKLRRDGLIALPAPDRVVFLDPGQLEEIASGDE